MPDDRGSTTPISDSKTATTLISRFGDVFGESLSEPEAIDLLVEYGKSLCLRVIDQVEQDDFRPDEPLLWYRNALEKARRRQQNRGGKRERATSSAYETHLAIDNQLLRMGYLTQEEYDARRQAWRTGGRFDRPECDRFYRSEVVEAYREREEGLRRWMERWSPRLNAARTHTERQAVIREMIGAALGVDEDTLFISDVLDGLASTQMRRESNHDTV